MEKKRRAGILMPIASLPSPYGIGTLGEAAYRFVDGLHAAGVKVWQMLPLLPTGFGNSPYQAPAADALNYYFIDLPALESAGLLRRADYQNVDFGSDERRVDYGKMFENRVAVLRKAFARFDQTKEEWKQFLIEGRYADFALFMSLKTHFSYRPFKEWGEAFKKFDATLTAMYIRENKAEIDFWQFTQFVFLKQWRALKNYANAKGIELMGDMPIYLSADSVEAWKKGSEVFLTDGDGNFSLVAGVPPDAFSETGQLWGNPVYDYPKMQKDGYAWWKGRIDRALETFDIVRIDHFRGFDRFYAVGYGETDAKNGEWMDGPKAELFVGRENQKIVAEDLGVIDDGVRELMKKTGYPGMKVFLFGLDGNPENEHLPSEYKENIYAYTGTHDNEPVFAYFSALEGEEKEKIEKILQEQCEKTGVLYRGESAEEQTQTAVELVFASKAEVAIAPYHDILGLGSEARINFPSVLSENNWSFRFTEKDFSADGWEKLGALVKKYGR